MFIWSYDTSRMEMDFLVQREGALLPIEVKGGTSIKATSLHNYLKEHLFYVALSSTGEYL